MFRKVQLAATFVMALSALPAMAAPVTVTVEGETRHFFSGPFDVSTPVTATWTYDTSQAPDISASQSIFYNAADSFSLTFDGYGTYSGENGRINQHQARGGTEYHEMSIGNGEGSLSGPVIGGLEIVYFFVRFRGDTFDDQDTMTNGFTANDAVFQDAVLRFEPLGGGSQIQVELNAFTRTFEFSTTGLPAPGALAMLGFGLFGLGIRRRTA